MPAQLAHGFVCCAISASPQFAQNSVMVVKSKKQQLTRAKGVKQARHATKAHFLCYRTAAFVQPIMLL